MSVDDERSSLESSARQTVEGSPSEVGVVEPKLPERTRASLDDSGGRSPLGRRTRHVFDQIPTAARVCALLAVVNAVCWSIITPPFEITDEPDHFAYVQQLAEGGSLPSSGSKEFSEEEQVAERDLHTFESRFDPSIRAISTRAEQEILERDLSGPRVRKTHGAAGLASSEPPLYYALQTIPYELGSSGTLLDRLALMRLLSALMAGITALFVFLFLREALPSAPWSWTVGGLCVALAPLLGYVSGAVNPDSMLTAVSATLFYCLAVAFRRGLTRRLAMVIGGVIAVGFMTKLNFVGLAPGAFLGLVLLTRRKARASGSNVYYRVLVPALLIALSPVILYALVNLARGKATLGIVSASLDAHFKGDLSIWHELSYIWQLYLPRLPGMHNYFDELFTTRQLWFNGLVGVYGWFDTVFPGWVYSVALVPAGIIAILCIRGLVVARTALKPRADEIFTYLSMILGILLLVGASGYPQASILPQQFAEPRYLLPLIPLWGAVLVLAVRGAGRRWGAVVGALIVVLIFGHDFFSQLQVIARYYG